MSDWIVVLCGYLLGSIPFAFLLARTRGGVDVRMSGSGNVGATNVLRLTGTSLGLTVLVLDIAKGATAVWFAQLAGGAEATRAAAGVAAVVGHVHPVWLRFRGGKGVAVACGVFSVLAPAVTGLAVVVFAAVVWVTRYVSLGSIVATVTVPPAAWLAGTPPAVVAAAAIVALLIVYRHRSNLARIRSGTERRIGRRADQLSHSR
jgi:glycerol-3-phosphate acyltransferase PlsY